MSGHLKYMLALVCCFILANLYYSQPIIFDIAQDLGINSSSSGVIVTITQIGYCLGVLFLVPLGDVLESRRLIKRIVNLSPWGKKTLGYNVFSIHYFYFVLGNGANCFTGLAWVYSFRCCIVFFAWFSCSTMRDFGG